ncbi:hypothetical protein SAMN00777080_0761 [Aquiflexum balticum DSM 16537]|uniref:Uncharacterized protein n=1 Tax=Aquiflexum balticum DSM 16537 TaxID=758820 RepID=A0A1W2H016_9BACT|nr:hypothetical protein SAMN00777080_0761 [Aquiflexum balticum DSM 16537]
MVKTENFQRVEVKDLYFGTSNLQKLRKQEFQESNKLQH